MFIGGREAWQLRPEEYIHLSAAPACCWGRLYIRLLPGPSQPKIAPLKRAVSHTVSCGNFV